VYELQFSGSSSDGAAPTGPSRSLQEGESCKPVWISGWRRRRSCLPQPPLAPLAALGEKGEPLRWRIKRPRANAADGEPWFAQAAGSRRCFAVPLTPCAPLPTLRESRPGSACQIGGFCRRRPAGSAVAGRASGCHDPPSQCDEWGRPLLSDPRLHYVEAGRSNRFATAALAPGPVRQQRLGCSWMRRRAGSCQLRLAGSRGLPGHPGLSNRTGVTKPISRRGEPVARPSGVELGPASDGHPKYPCCAPLKRLRSEGATANRGGTRSPEDAGSDAPAGLPPGRWAWNALAGAEALGSATAGRPTSACPVPNAPRPFCPLPLTLASMARAAARGTGPTTFLPACWWG